VTLVELVTILEAAGYPVVYSHFTETSNNPIPSPPFITYLVPNTSNFFADNKVYKKINNVDAELYTRKKDLLAEATLESFLDANELAYEKTGTWIESQGLFQIIYEIGVI